MPLRRKIRLGGFGIKKTSSPGTQREPGLAQSVERLTVVVRSHQQVVGSNPSTWTSFFFGLRFAKPPLSSVEEQSRDFKSIDSALVQSQQWGIFFALFPSWLRVANWRRGVIVALILGVCEKKPIVKPDALTARWTPRMKTGGGCAILRASGTKYYRGLGKMRWETVSLSNGLQSTRPIE